MTLPRELLQAIASDEGGKVAVVIGAGCSVELPTELPVSRRLAEDAHARLLANGVLHDGDCRNPADLSCLADAVFDKTGHQDDLVGAFPLAKLRNAAPNDGYRLAVALLREQAISDLLTLNFDLAIRHALGEMNSGSEVSVVGGPESADAIGVVNVIYLHRDADAPADEWILRTLQLDEAWRDRWEELVTTRVMNAPVVVFAGLGTAASVLLETIGRIRRALPDHISIHVDPDPFGSSEFTAALAIPEERFVQAGWTAFMLELAARVVVEQLQRLRRAVEELEQQLALAAEDHSHLFDLFQRLNLLQLGVVRARWLLREDAYLPARSSDPRLMADLVQATSVLARELGVTFVPEAEGRLQMRRNGEVVGVLVPASGAGVLDWPRFEAAVMGSRALRSHISEDPLLVLAAGVPGARTAVVAPENIIDDEDPENTASGFLGPIIIDASDLRTVPAAALASLR